MPAAAAAATATAAYSDRFPTFKTNGFYRTFNGLTVSTLGLGTYLGNADEADDRLYMEAIEKALLSGVNLLDSAINYRCMRSERNIGTALRKLETEGKLKRSEVVVCTKGGFIPYDGEPPRDGAAYFHREYVAQGICGPEDLVAGCHVMTTSYLKNQVERSLRNLGVNSIDLYYLHNPEIQLDEMDPPEFYKRLALAFESLEDQVKEGKISSYGTATWNGYRVPPSETGHLSLEKVLRASEKAGGSRHHFRAVQLPYNLGMAEAYAAPTQNLGSQSVSLLAAAKANEVAVFTSASILQSRLTKNLPPAVMEAFPEFSADSQRSIQFARSTPGVTAALVGMRKAAHVVENLGVAAYPPSEEASIEGLFKHEGPG
jgi:aryl-alcohol dehydrogenase-like predicted oxidoreductase